MRLSTIARSRNKPEQASSHVRDAPKYTFASFMASLGISLAFHLLFWGDFSSVEELA